MTNSNLTADTVKQYVVQICGENLSKLGSGVIVKTINEGKYHYCVLTAAHCFDGEKIKITPNKNNVTIKYDARVDLHFSDYTPIEGHDLGIFFLNKHLSTRIYRK